MTERDDELLAKLVAGDLTLDSADIQALFAARPDLAERARELQSLAADFAREGPAERHAIAAARTATTDADRAAVRASYAATVGAPPVRRPRRTLWLLAAAAIVVVAAAGTFLWRERTGPASKDEFLDANEHVIELADPGQPLAAGVTLTWSEPGNQTKLSNAERWRVRFQSLDTDGRPDSLLLEVKCDEATWKLEAADMSAWPEVVSWSVQRVDSNNRVLASSPSLRFSLSR